MLSGWEEWLFSQNNTSQLLGSESLRMRKKAGSGELSFNFPLTVLHCSGKEHEQQFEKICYVALQVSEQGFHPPLLCGRGELAGG